MSKRDAAIYREAAKIMASDAAPWIGSCEAVAYLVGDRGLFSQTVKSYEKLFRPGPPYKGLMYWGSLWSEIPDEVRNCRILALCFAAAMAESGDL